MIHVLNLSFILLLRICNLCMIHYLSCLFSSFLRTLSIGYNAIKNKGGVLFFIDWIDCIYVLYLSYTYPEMGGILIYRGWGGFKYFGTFIYIPPGGGGATLSSFRDLLYCTPPGIRAPGVGRL